MLEGDVCMHVCGLAGRSPIHIHVLEILLKMRQKHLFDPINGAARTSVENGTVSANKGMWGHPSSDTGNAGDADL